MRKPRCLLCKSPQKYKGVCRQCMRLTLLATTADEGNSSNAGMPGDAVQCLIPYNDDVLLFGCSHSIWQLTGDPQAGGELDAISYEIGMPKGRPYCVDPLGQVYFFGSKCGIWRLTPAAGGSSLPQRVSQSIEQLIENVNLNQVYIRLVYDLANQGVGVFITPIAGGPTTNFFWEERVNAWWPDAYGNPSFNPTAVIAFEGADPSDRNIMTFGQDGYVRIVSDAATTDDGTPINSYVFFGPIHTPDLEEILITELHAFVGLGSGSVTYDIFMGRSPEEAFNSLPIASLSGQWAAGRNHTTPIYRAGAACYVRVSSTNQWALERINAIFRPYGLSPRTRA